MHKKHHWKYSLTGINEFNHRYMNQKHLTIHIYLQTSICYAIHYTNKIGMKYIPLAKGKKIDSQTIQKNILRIHIICNYANDIELSPGTTHIFRNNKFQI